MSFFISNPPRRPSDRGSSYTTASGATSSRIVQRRDIIRATIMFSIPFMAWFVVFKVAYWVTSFLVSVLAMLLERVRRNAKIRFPFFATVTLLYSAQLMLLALFLTSPKYAIPNVTAPLEPNIYLLAPKAGDFVTPPAKAALRGMSTSVQTGALAVAAPPHYTHDAHLLKVQSLPRPYDFDAASFKEHRNENVVDIRAPQFMERFYFQEHGSLATVSVILSAFNEHTFIQRTLDSICNSTHPAVLLEIILVDDASDPPMVTAVDTDKYHPPLFKVIRHETRQGLIRSKINGGNSAMGDVLVFLDAHVRPDPGWVVPILRHINTNYKRVVVPTIPMLNGTDWTVNRHAVGIKMMFEWDLQFHWFDDGNDYVPCMSGGLLAMSREWWAESGTLDVGMLQWGGENIEQSIRIWLCGGEIVVARDSIIAHVFRDKFPYPIDNDLIVRNKVRTVEGWWDQESKGKFYEAAPHAMKFQNDVGDLSSREEIKEKLNCRPFSWYINRFRDVFVDRGMLKIDSFQLRSPATDLCLAEVNSAIVVEHCDPTDVNQKWGTRYNGTSIQNYGTGKCLDAANPRPGGVPYAAKGKFTVGVKYTAVDHKVLAFACEAGNHNQYWILDGGRLAHASFCASYVPPSAPPTRPVGVQLFSCGRDETNQVVRGIPAGQQFVPFNHQQLESLKVLKRREKKQESAIPK